MIIEAPAHISSQRDVMYLPLSGSTRNMPRVVLLNQYHESGRLLPDDQHVYRVIDEHGIIARDHFTTYQEAITRLLRNCGWGNIEACDGAELRAQESAVRAEWYAAGRGDPFDTQIAIKRAAYAHYLAYERGEVNHSPAIPSFYDTWHKEHDTNE